MNLVSFSARMLAFLVAITAWIVGPGASPGYARMNGVDFASGDLSAVRAHLLATDAGGVADHLIQRHTAVVPGPAGVKWGAGARTSSNWAGYVDDLGSTGVLVGEARIFVKAKFVNSSSPRIGSWAGIGGVNGGNLWQAGIDDYTMTLWTELLPASPVYTTITASTGDTIFSDVWEDMSNPGNYYLLIENYTTGQYTIATGGCCPDRTTADFITEATAGSTIPTISGQIDFTGGLWYKRNDNVVQYLDSSAAQTYWKYTAQRGQQCIHTSILSAHQNFNHTSGC